MTGEPMVITDALRAAIAPDRLPWERLADGVAVSWIHRPADDGPGAAFLRYEPGARVPYHCHPGFERIIVLSGSQSDQHGRYPAGTVVVNRPGTGHSVASDEGCVVLIVWEKPVVFVAEPG